MERLREEKDAGAGAMTSELEQLAAERDAARADTEAAVAAERERWQGDIDDLHQAFADAAAEAETARDRHRAELAALEDQLRAERAAVARMSAELARRPEPGEQQAAAAPTQPMPPTEAMPPPTSSSSPAADPADPVSIEGAVLDAPGPLRAGARPPSAPKHRAGR